MIAPVGERVVFAALVVLVLVAIVIYRQRSLAAQERSEGYIPRMLENPLALQPLSGTTNFHALAEGLQPPCDEQPDHDKAMLSPLIAFRDQLATPGNNHQTNYAYEQGAPSRTGYTTGAWRPEWRPPAEERKWAPVVSDEMGPALGPVIDPGGEFSARQFAGRVLHGNDGANVSALSGAGARSDAIYNAQVPTWVDTPTAGDFYSPEAGSARPVHELGGPGAVPQYNVLSEPSHSPLIGSGNPY